MLRWVLLTGQCHHLLGSWEEMDSCRLQVHPFSRRYLSFCYWTSLLLLSVLLIRRTHSTYNQCLHSNMICQIFFFLANGFADFCNIYLYVYFYKFSQIEIFPLSGCNAEYSKSVNRRKSKHTFASLEWRATFPNYWILGTEF